MYGHLSKIFVLEKTLVGTETPIAISGNTGSTTGPHLHFTLQKENQFLDPKTILN